jgi:hypothetical protein
METVNAITKLELQCHTLLKELEQQLQAKRPQTDMIEDINAMPVYQFLYEL